MLFGYFSSEEKLPMCIQYGYHDSYMYVHRHADFCEIVTVLDGTAVHVTGDRRVQLKRGDLFVMREGTDHGYELPSGLRICNMMIRADRMKELEQSFSGISGFRTLFMTPYEQSGGLWLSAEVLESVSALISRMTVEYDTMREGREQILPALFAEFIITVSRYCGTPMKKYEKSGIESAAVYLEEHYMEDSPIKKAGELTHYSRRHFERLFSDIYGITPSRYLTDVRIKRARQLLVTTDMPIATIAQQCGFCDASYFTKVFRENTGTAPKAFRMSE